MDAYIVNNLRENSHLALEKQKGKIKEYNHLKLKKEERRYILV
jgi:hypothetical protein